MVHADEVGFDAYSIIEHHVFQILAYLQIRSR
jgi:hypothetical protein